MNNQIAFEDVFDVVIEPDYSKGILLELQQKHSLSTIDFVTLYKQGVELLPCRETRDWLYNLKMFLAADGQLVDLAEGFTKADMAIRCSNEYRESLKEAFSYDVNNMDKNIKTEVKRPLFYFYCETM